MSESRAGGLAMVRALWQVAGPQRRNLGWGIALRMVQGLLSTVPVIVVVLALRQILDGEEIETAQVLWWTLIVAASAVAQYVVGLQSSRLTWIVGYEDAAALRIRAVEHLRRVPISELTRRQSGDLATVLTQDMRMLEPVVADVVPSLLGAAVVPVVVVVVTLVVDWRLGLAALLTLVIAAPVFAVTHRRLARLGTLRADRQASAVARMLEYISGIAVIRAYNQTGERMERFRAALDDYRRTNLHLVQKLAPLLTAVTLTIELGFAVVLLVSVLLVTGGEVTTATVLVFLVLSLRIYQPILAIVGQSELLRIAEASLDRVSALLEIEPQPQPTTPLPPASPTVTFDDVHFAYGVGTDEENGVLEGVSFELRPGTLNALVGPSGAGKSTVAGLVARFSDVQRGHVRVGGVDVRDLDADTLLDSVAVVLQDSYLFGDTIANNLRLGAPDATDDDLVAAARAARCHDFISGLPRAYDTVVGEGGATLSGGQRQRVCIARALLKDSPIVILDEPTAAIDPTNERRLQEALAALVAGRTVLVIAHRLASIRGADQVLVLDERRIVERGTHDDLVAAGGRYARLWQAQERATGWRIGRAGVPAQR